MIGQTFIKCVPFYQDIPLVVKILCDSNFLFDFCSNCYLRGMYDWSNVNEMCAFLQRYSISCQIFV